MNRPRSAKNRACSLVHPCLLIFNILKLIIMQLRFKFNCTGCHINTLPCLHATCRNWMVKSVLFVDAGHTHILSACQTSSIFPGTGFRYENSMPKSSVQPYLDQAAEILILCHSPGSAKRMQIAIASRTTVTFATLNPLLTLTNSLIAFRVRDSTFCSLSCFSISCANPAQLCMLTFSAITLERLAWISSNLHTGQAYPCSFDWCITWYKNRT